MSDRRKNDETSSGEALESTATDRWVDYLPSAPSMVGHTRVGVPMERQPQRQETEPSRGVGPASAAVAAATEDSPGAELSTEVVAAQQASLDGQAPAEGVSAREVSAEAEAPAEIVSRREVSAEAGARADVMSALEVSLEAEPTTGPVSAREEAPEDEPGVGGSAASPERLLQTREVVTGLFSRLGADVDVEVRDGPGAIACNVRLKRGGAALQVGPRGQVLEAIQYLTNRMVNRGAEGRKWISLELGGFRDDSGEPAMVEMARRLAESARRIGQTLTIVPIQSRDRRVIHTALAEASGVKTRSEGEGNLRRLLIEVEKPQGQGG